MKFATVLLPKSVVVVPYSRDFGRTRSRSEDIFRSGQQAALGKDLIDLLDAIKIERATLDSYDWEAALPAWQRDPGQNGFGRSFRLSRRG